MEPAGTERVKKIIEQVISTLQIDLSGLTVLTEAGSGLFVYTPLIAARAGATQVFVWTRDSSYGKASDIIERCKQLAHSFGVPDVMVFAENNRPTEHIEKADIITNLGFVRPLNEEFLKKVKHGTVIPAMCEAWEVREKDIDVTYCKKKNIPLAGTWENFPAIEVFNYSGPLAVKLAHEGGFEVFKNNIVVWSDDHFGQVISETFKRFGAKNVIMTTSVEQLYENSSGLDFVFLCDYSEQATLLGKDGIIDIAKIKEWNPSCGFIHLYGKVDSAFLRENNISFYPQKDGYASVMSHTLAYLGPAPVINLHAAGLKVGECLKKNVEHELVQKM